MRGIACPYCSELNYTDKMPVFGCHPCSHCELTFWYDPYKGEAREVPEHTRTLQRDLNRRVIEELEDLIWFGSKKGDSNATQR